MFNERNPTLTSPILSLLFLDLNPIESEKCLS